MKNTRAITHKSNSYEKCETKHKQYGSELGERVSEKKDLELYNGTQI